MVVMVLLTMITAFAMPGLRGSLFSDQLKGTARRLTGLVAETGQEAVRTQAEQFLHFDLEHNQVWTSAMRPVPVKETSPAGDQTPDPGTLEEKEGRRLAIPDSVRVVDITTASGGKQSAGETAIRFSTKGYVDKTLIHLRDQDGRDLTLVLSPFLAVTRILDSYVEIEDDKARY